ncbi:MAG: bifunctional DNA-formamidopyrimidine glycosylase/DNA-(apurinic or apyrimidinic site) lyase [Pseudomonadota bacterium]
MPELPEVETVRRGLAPVMEGARIERLELRRKDLRFPFAANFQAALDGGRVVSLGRRAKYLLLDMEADLTVIMHLGMSGSFRVEVPVEAGDNTAVPGAFHHAKSRLAAHDHVIFHLRTRDGSKARVVYNDPRRFGFMLTVPRSARDAHPMLADLGMEPTGNALSAHHLAARFAGRKTPIKAALLDQKNIAGLGNIYVCEALWRSQISPRRLAGTLVTKAGMPSIRLERLTGHVRDVIAEAIDAGGSSLRDHAATDGSLGYFQHRFSAYDREGEPCGHGGCGGTIRRIVQSGRSTFYCPRCQR